MNTTLKFIASTAIWLLLFLPMVILSFVVVPVLLTTDWNGRTTWFGNFKYGRGGSHYKAQTRSYLEQLLFLCVRNPVSNFGKQVISVRNHGWVWLQELHLGGRWYWKFGWKDLSPDNGDLRTFVYRPWRHK